MGHSTASLTRNRTLKNLYINPLVEILGKQNHATEFQPNTTSPLHGIFDTDPSQSLTLLIDFKSFGPDLWPRVIEQLEPLRSRNYLTYFNGTTVIPGPIIVVGTGNTPFDLLVSNTTYRDVFFDAPLDKMWEALERRDNGSPNDALLKNLGSTAAIKQSKGHARVGMRQGDRSQQYEDHPGDLGDTTNMVQDNNRTTNPTNPDIHTPENSYYASVSFGKAIGRLWRNQLSSHQMELIRGHIRGAHRRGLKVRYWDLPDWPIGWRNHVWDVLVEEGVDLLNVDDLEGAARRDWGRRDWWW